MVRKTKEDAEKTRSRILAEAEKLFVEQGYVDTSIAQICEKSEISKGALFHYFSTKSDLFKVVWTDLQFRMDESCRNAAIAARSKTDVYASFLAGTRMYLEWACRPDYQQVVLKDGPAVLGMAGWFGADNKLGHEQTMAGMTYLSTHGNLDPELVIPIAVLFHNALNGAGFAISRDVPGITPESAFKAFEAVIRSVS